MKRAILAVIALLAVGCSVQPPPAASAPPAPGPLRESEAQSGPQGQPGAPPTLAAPPTEVPAQGAADRPAFGPPPLVEAAPPPPPPPPPPRADNRPAQPARRAQSDPLGGSSTIGQSTVSSGKVSNAPAVVAAMAKEFRRCYTMGLGQDANMRGSLKVTAKIGQNGQVISAVPSGGDGLSREVIDCVARRVSAAIFEHPEGGNATLVIPVAFSNDSAP